MNRRLIGVFTFALVVAAATSALVYRLVVSQVRPAATKQALPANHLVVAAHDLQVGALVAEPDLQEVDWAGPVPDGAIKTRAELVGRGVLAPVYKDEPLTERRLAQKGAGAGLASTIPVGKRAVALRVNDVIGLAGFVLPGMRVDVLVAGNAPGAESTGTRCRTVLQNIEVLSAGQKIERAGDGKPEAAEVVNLLVTPEQAEVLNLASSETKVQLVLRNPLDTEEQKTAGTNISTLLGVKAAPVLIAERSSRPVAGPPPVPIVEMYNGTKRIDQPLSMPTEKRP